MLGLLGMDFVAVVVFVTSQMSPARRFYSDWLWPYCATCECEFRVNSNDWQFSIILCPLIPSPLDTQSKHYILKPKTKCFLASKNEIIIFSFFEIISLKPLEVVLVFSLNYPMNGLCQTWWNTGPLFGLFLKLITMPKIGNKTTKALSACQRNRTATTLLRQTSGHYIVIKQKLLSRLHLFSSRGQLKLTSSNVHASTSDMSECPGCNSKRTMLFTSLPGSMHIRGF